MHVFLVDLSRFIAIVHIFEYRLCTITHICADPWYTFPMRNCPYFDHRHFVGWWYQNGYINIDMISTLTFILHVYWCSWDIYNDIYMGYTLVFILYTLIYILHIYWYSYGIHWHLYSIYWYLHWYLFWHLFHIHNGIFIGTYVAFVFVYTWSTTQPILDQCLHIIANCSSDELIYSLM